MSIENINSLSRQLCDELNKYTHFLLGAAIAAIAYGLEKIEGKALSNAMFFWL